MGYTCECFLFVLLIAFVVVRTLIRICVYSTLLVPKNRNVYGGEWTFAQAKFHSCRLVSYRVSNGEENRLFFHQSNLLI